jgi:8-oxo-dGTP diphosphatase
MEPEIDPYGRPYPPKTGGYYLPNTAADALVTRMHEGALQILLITRGHEPQIGHLAFPGGHIDYNEDPEDACVRELKEETGVVGTNPQLAMVRGKPDRDARKHMITIAYHVEVDPN